MSAPEMELRRAVEDAPTRSGFYYASYKESGQIEIALVNVVTENNYVHVFIPGSYKIYYVSEFKWFGPVPTCVESGK